MLKIRSQPDSGSKNDRAAPSSKKDSKKIRTKDDLELLRIILDENPVLKNRVQHFLVKSLGKKPNSKT